MIKYITFLLRQNSFIQVLLLCFFCFSCELIVKLVKLPLPGSILGFGLVLFLLVTNKLKPEYIKNGAQLLLKEMLLFFIPAVIAILDHPEFLGILGIKILIVIILSTINVILITVLVVDYCYHWRLSHAKSISD